MATIPAAHLLRCLLEKSAYISIAEITLGLDRIMPQSHAQFLAQLAHVSFDHVLFNVFVKNSIDGIENLRLADAPATITDQIFQYVALSPWQYKLFAIYFRVAAIEIYMDARVHLLNLRARVNAPPYGINTRQNFADMYRLAHHIINAAHEKLQCLLKGARFIQRDDRSPAMGTDHIGVYHPLVEVAQQKPLHTPKIRVRCRYKPFPEIAGIEAQRSKPFTAKTRNIAVRYDLSLINNNVHNSTQPAKTTIF